MNKHLVKSKINYNVSDSNKLFIRIGLLITFMILSYLFSAVSNAQSTGYLDWKRQFGTASSDAINYDTDRNGDIVFDGFGNIYVAGNTIHSNSSTNVWIAKFNNAGQMIWFREFGFGADDRVTDLAIDSKGYIYAGGYYSNPPNNLDIWIAKFDKDGTREWLKTTGTQAQDGKYGFVIKPDNKGGGKFFTFKDERKTLAVFPFFSDGTIGMSFDRPFNMQGFPRDIAVGSDDSVYVVGEFVNRFQIDNRFLYKYSGEGQLEVIDGEATENSNTAQRVVVDSANNVFVAGTDWYSSKDIWIKKYDPYRIPYKEWTQYISSSKWDSVEALALDGGGNLTIGGMTEGTLFGASNSSNKADAWFARIHRNTGNIAYGKQFEVNDIDGTNVVASDACGSVVLSGYTVNMVANIGFTDAFLIRFAPPALNPPLAPSKITGISPTSGFPGSTFFVTYQSTYSLSGIYFIDGIKAPSALPFQPIGSFKGIVPQGATTGPITLTTRCDHVTSSTNFVVR